MRTYLLRNLFAGIFLVALCGCASAPITVAVPVAVKCSVEVGPAPEFPDTKEAILGTENIATRVNLLLAGRILRDNRIGELTSALDGCLSKGEDQALSQVPSEGSPMLSKPTWLSDAPHRYLGFLGL